MLFLNPIVISEKIYSDSFLKTKAFFASLFIHTALLVGIFHFASTQFVKVEESESASITISLSDYVPPSVTTKTEPLKEILTPKKIVQKPKKTSVVQPTSVIKKRTPEMIQPKENSAVVSSEAFTPAVQNVEQPVTEESEVISSAISDSNSPSANVSLSKQEIKNEELARIRLMIQNSLRYPAIAKKLKVEGVVFITFSLSSGGHVENLQLLQSSGSSALDNRALQTVSSLDGEYPHLSKKVDLKIPISFSLQKS